MHRDLKPSNVLIHGGLSGGDIRPVITDFGLARFISGSQATAVFTATGEILGTPGYMAPEQAGGATSEIGIATDVYGLGAILYSLLTGQPPFSGDSVAGILLRIRSEEPTAPRKIDRAIPRDLETICLRCLAKRPMDRYVSAPELVDDLVRFLDGRPIAARPVGARERLVRWSRRNPVVSGLSAALLAVLLGGLVAMTSLWLVAENRREIAEANYLDAQAQRRRAQHAVDQMYTQVAQWLDQNPHTMELRKKLLKAAWDAYLDFANEQSADPEVMTEAAEACYRLALIDRRLAHDGTSKVYAREALRRFQTLAASFPDKVRYRFDIFHCHFLLGEWNEAYEMIRPLCADDPSGNHRDALAAVTAVLGDHLTASNPDRAEALFREGLAMSNELQSEFPNKLPFARQVGSNYFYWARLKLWQGDLPTAFNHSQHAIACCKKVADAFPNDTGYQEQLIQFQQLASVIAYFQSDYTVAEDYAERCHQTAKQLLYFQPESYASWESHQRSLNHLLHLALARADQEKALSVATEYLVSLESSYDKWPNRPAAILRLAVFLADCALQALLEERDSKASIPP